MQSTRQLDAVEVTPHGSLSDIYLRKNITSKDMTDENGVTQTVWSADEVHFVAAMTADEVTAAFETLWAAHVNDGKTDTERLSTCEDSILDLAEGLLGVLS